MKGNDCCYSRLLFHANTHRLSANKMYYHTRCKRNFHNKLNKAQKQTKQKFTQKNELGWIKSSALNKMFYYECDIKQQEPSKVFKVNDKENMYIELLKCRRVEFQSHGSCSVELLLKKNTELEKWTLLGKILCVSEGL